MSSAFPEDMVDSMIKRHCVILVAGNPFWRIILCLLYFCDWLQIIWDKHVRFWWLKVSINSTPLFISKIYQIYIWFYMDSVFASKPLLCLNIFSLFGAKCGLDFIIL